MIVELQLAHERLTSRDVADSDRDPESSFLGVSDHCVWTKHVSGQACRQANRSLDFLLCLVSALPCM